jgi:hypothetical protein
MKHCPMSVLVAVGLLFAAGCSEWQHDVTLQGVTFSKVRTVSDGRLIGQIPADTVVRGRPCAQGWLHLHPTGVPAVFAATREIAMARCTIPARTWVFQDRDGVVTICAFPQDTLVQGHQCRGSGGPKGVQTSFYPDGALRQFFPVKQTVIDGVPCATGLIRGSVELHENGRLKSCMLGEDLVREGMKLGKGTRIALTMEGRILK